MDIVQIQNVDSIPAETSLDMNTYYKVFDYKANRLTTAINLTTNAHLSREDAIEGARLGQWELQVPKFDGNGRPLNIKKFSSTYKRNDDLFLIALGLGGLMTAGFCIFGK